MDDSINFLDRIEFKEIFDKHSFLIYELSKTKSSYKTSTDTGRKNYGEKIGPLHGDIATYIKKCFEDHTYENCKKFKGFKYTTPLGNNIKFECNDKFEKAWIEIE